MRRAYRSTAAAEGATVTLTINGESGGRWTLRRERGEWVFYAGAPDQPTAEAILDQDTAWRLFTKGITSEQARREAIIEGDAALAEPLLHMVSIIA